MEPGDIIVAIDGRDTARMGPSAVEAALRGPIGTALQLDVLRGDAMEELAERFARGEAADVDLEAEELEGEAPGELSARYVSESELEIEVDWPEDPPA